MTDWRANAAFDGHEDLIRVGDAALGLAGFIAIHSTALGPSAGGVRIWTYADEDAALTDALRLSRGMTYKNAMADLPLGGGKAVLYKMGPDRAACFERFGEQIDALGGRYVTAEDVGATGADMAAVAKRTRFVTGAPKSGAAGAGGDPSPWTGLGVFLTIEKILGGVAGRTVAVQGVGAVGFDLCERLAAAGAKLIVADIDPARLQRAKALGAQTAPVERIHAIPADLLAPCALGAGLSADTIPDIAAPIICGAANNQLATEADGARLAARGVTYAPDYVVNAGGIINVSAEYLGESSAAVEARVRAIPDRVMRVLDAAKREGVPPHQAADRIVRARLAEARHG
jgi:leucine dehydrogenase